MLWNFHIWIDSVFQRLAGWPASFKFQTLLSPTSQHLRVTSSRTQVTPQFLTLNAISYIDCTIHSAASEYNLLLKRGDFSAFKDIQVSSSHYDSQKYTPRMWEHVSLWQKGRQPSMVLKDWLCLSKPHPGHRLTPQCHSYAPICSSDHKSITSSSRWPQVSKKNM
jgi:hypothetical protein